jgi:single-stranded DNA-binding protein
MQQKKYDWFKSMNLFFTGGSNNGLNSSQMVRQGLRAVVSGRTQQSNVGNSNNPNSNTRRSPLDPMGPNSGVQIVDNNTNNNNPNNNLMINQQQQQLPGSMMNNSSELDSPMRFNFDMAQGEKNV